MEKEEESNPFLVKQAPGAPFEPEPTPFSNLPDSSSLSKPKPEYHLFHPIKYSEVMEEKERREPEAFETPVFKKQERIILEQPPGKSKTFIMLLVILAALMLIVYIYLAHFRSSEYELKIGDNIDDAYIKEGALYVHLLPADYEIAETINFFLIDSKGKEHLYSTYHLAADHEIYPEDVSLENFDGLRTVYAEFDYSALSPYPSNLSSCGNGVVDFGESCDGNNVSGKTCEDFFIHGEGELTCCAGCNNFDLQNCRNLTYTTCTDSDSGNNYYLSGSVSVEFNYTKGDDCSQTPSDIIGSGGSYYQDRCSGDNLVEYYCSADKSVGTTEYNCSSEGKVCELGECKEPMFSSLNVWDSLSRLFRKLADNVKND